MAWVQQYHRLVHDGLVAQDIDEITFLSRSAFAGSQRYGVILWSGKSLTQKRRAHGNL
eukprot:COSAG04_NODE_544_length_12827_cov_262.923421_1_plen_58_part_00